jgi:hypothetical protein
LRHSAIYLENITADLAHAISPLAPIVAEEDISNFRGVEHLDHGVSSNSGANKSFIGRSRTPNAFESTES